MVLRSVKKRIRPIVRHIITVKWNVCVRCLRTCRDEPWPTSNALSPMKCIVELKVPWWIEMTWNSKTQRILIALLNTRWPRNRIERRQPRVPSAGSSLQLRDNKTMGRRVVLMIQTLKAIVIWLTWLTKWSQVRRIIMEMMHRLRIDYSSSRATLMRVRRL